MANGHEWLGTPRELDAYIESISQVQSYVGQARTLALKLQAERECWDEEHALRVAAERKIGRQRRRITNLEDCRRYENETTQRLIGTLKDIAAIPDDALRIARGGLFAYYSRIDSIRPDVASIEERSEVLGRGFAEFDGDCA